MTPEEEYKRGVFARVRQYYKPRIYPPKLGISGKEWVAVHGNHIWVARSLAKLCSILPVVPEQYRGK